MRDQNEQERTPTLEEWMNRFPFRRPNYFDDPRTPPEMIVKAVKEWDQAIEDKYFKLYGDRKIESMRRRKEGE